MAGRARLCAGGGSKQVEGTLYCAGQAAVEADGRSSTADMKTQLLLALRNLEQVISEQVMNAVVLCG